MGWLGRRLAKKIASNGFQTARGGRPFDRGVNCKISVQRRGTLASAARATVLTALPFLPPLPRVFVLAHQLVRHSSTVLLKRCPLLFFRLFSHAVLWLLLHHTTGPGAYRILSKEPVSFQGRFLDSSSASRKICRVHELWGVGDNIFVDSSSTASPPTVRSRPQEVHLKLWGVDFEMNCG